MKTITLSLLAGAVLAVCMPASASNPNLISNGSFESGTPIGNNGDLGSQQLFKGATTLSSWIVIGKNSLSDIAWIGSNNPYGLTASAGSNFLDLTGWQTGNLARGKGVMQTIDTVAGQQYTVSFDLGNSIYYNANGVELSVQAADLSDFAYLTNYSTNYSINSWNSFSYSFTAASAKTAVSFAGSSTGSYIGLDNVSVTAVPEPETYAMLLAGMGLVGAIARRRKASKA